MEDVDLATAYNWAGDTIIRDTVMWDKRAVLGYQSIYIPTDIREWISSADSEVMKSAIKEAGLPETKEAGTFDLRAWKAWKYVAENIEYVGDKAACGMEDFWFFPEETLMIKKGDCEDSSFLLASLMIAGGVSEQCVRVVLGNVIASDGTFGHAWVVYQNEAGKWCLLESTLDEVPSNMVEADPQTQSGGKYQYQPQFCLNGSHLWWISSSAAPLAEYLKSRSRKSERKVLEVIEPARVF